MVRNLLDSCYIYGLFHEKMRVDIRGGGEGCQMLNIKPCKNKLKFKKPNET